MRRINRLIFMSEIRNRALEISLKERQRWKIRRKKCRPNFEKKKI